MLQALGGESLMLLLPAGATAADPGGTLGLMDPGVQQVAISPVVSHSVTTGNMGPRRRIEFTLPASAIADQLPGLGMGTADDLFNAVLGLMYDGDMYHIEKVIAENFAGTVYLYVVTAIE